MLTAILVYHRLDEELLGDSKGDTEESHGLGQW